VQGTNFAQIFLLPRQTISRIVVVSDVCFLSLKQTLPAAPQHQRTTQLTHGAAMHEPTQLECLHATSGLCVKPKLGKAQIPELYCLTTHKVILSTILNF